MRISGTEPSLVILYQNRMFQILERDVQKLPNQAEAKGDGVIKAKN